jgi:hypothetical protein
MGRVNALLVQILRLSSKPGIVISGGLPVRIVQTRGYSGTGRRGVAVPGEGGSMVGNLLLHDILRDEHLTRGLGDAEARALVEWLVDQAEKLAQTEPAELAQAEVKRLCRRGRGIAHFVALWCLEGQWGAAAQLAASERFDWPLPDGPVDPCELMQLILAWEDQYAELRRPRPNSAA